MSDDFKWCTARQVMLTYLMMLVAAPASQPVDLNAPIVPAAPAAVAPTAGTAPGTELPPSEWNAEDWDVQKPQLNLLEIDGYFRVRPDLIVNGALGNDAMYTNRAGPQDPSTPTVSESIGRVRSLTTSPRDNTQGGANMRLRIQPTLNITEDIQLVAQFDILDNIVMGSTPESMPRNGQVVNILELGGQNSPNVGWNTLRDAIQVRRVYGKVATPLGELRFGRMPNHWGLGMYANAGDCIDCDHSNNVDRIAFVGMLGSFYLVPMIDYMAEGPTTLSQAQPWSYARDLDQMDDAVQLSLQFAKKDAPEDIKDMLQRGDVVVNYGLWPMFRFQARENARYYLDPTNPEVTLERQARDAFAFVADGYFKLQYKKFTFEAEAVFTYARFKLPANNLEPSLTGTGEPPTGAATPDDQLVMNYARQFGAAIDARYDFLPELYVRLRAGFATGDRDDFNRGRFGIGQDAYLKRGESNANPVTSGDTTIDNFQFARDYRVDLILFREILGTISGAYYIKPEVSYTFSNGLGARFAPLFASAVYSQNTPGGQAPLGFELDFEAFYSPLKKRGFDASIQYGLFIPMAGLRNVNTGVDASLAHRILGRMAIQF